LSGLASEGWLDDHKGAVRSRESRNVLGLLRHVSYAPISVETQPLHTPSQTESEPPAAIRSSESHIACNVVLLRLLQGCGEASDILGQSGYRRAQHPLVQIEFLRPREVALEDRLHGGDDAFVVADQRHL
jgi:hypothetical protein